MCPSPIGHSNVGHLTRQRRSPKDYATLMKRPLLTTVLSGILLAGATLSAEPQLVNYLAAVVNDRIITFEEVRREVSRSELESAYSLYRRRPQELERELIRLHRLALDKLVERQLILHEFESGGKYQLPDTILEEELKDRIREEFGDRRNMLRTLQTMGMSYDTYKRKIRERFIVRAMQGSRISSSLIISPHKIETYYRENQKQYELEDRVRLRMITLMNRPDRDAEATRKKAEELLAEIVTDRPFPELASIHSDEYRREGGDRGWVTRTTYAPEITAAAFRLKAGEHSGVIQLDSGCFLLQVEEVQPAHVQSLPEVRTDIEGRLRELQLRTLYQEWIAQLKAKSHIQYFTPGG